MALLWHVEYWDGPLSGVAEHDGRLVWAACDKEALPEARVYLLYPLSDAEIEAERTRHELFRAHVGTHCDYVDGQRSGQVRPQAEWRRYYDAYPPQGRPDYTDRPALATISLSALLHP